MLNIANKIDPAIATLFDQLNQVHQSLGLPYVVVGASARDLLFVYGYGAKIQRATADVDFAIEIADWTTFYALKKHLCEAGFREARNVQRLFSPTDMPIDIIPFGGIEDEKTEVAMPPDGDFVMNTLGFQEAFDNAMIIRIQDNPVVDIPVVTSEGLILLKLIAWTDRISSKRTKDAKDIYYILQNYEEIPEVQGAVYTENNGEIIESYGWDVKLASAHLLGQRARHIAREPTIKVLTELFRTGVNSLDLELLSYEMLERHHEGQERCAELIQAFVNGFV